jgi:hypothetical protein
MLPLVTDHPRYRWGIISASVVICGITFLRILSKTRDKRVASEITSIFHHAIVVALALACVPMNFSHLLEDSVLSASARFPLVNTIQWINIGYFIYDTVNAIVWEHDFIFHHAVALVGLVVSDLSGICGLSNTVNTLIAEIGSIAYNVYSKKKSRTNYIRFVSVYAASRLVFAVWTIAVYAQVKEHLSFAISIPLMVIVLQIILLLVNVHFLSMHLRNLRQILSNAKGDN